MSNHPCIHMHTRGHTHTHESVMESLYSPEEDTELTDTQRERGDIVTMMNSALVSTLHPCTHEQGEREREGAMTMPFL